jgi:hypothetical protein
MRFRPAPESLEERLELAGNITTSLVAGNLTVTDNGAVSFKISQPSANKITLTPTAAGTTINGQTAPVTINSVTGNLTINLGTGKDNLTFDLSQSSINVRNVSITGSTGDKTVLATTAGQDNFLNVHSNYSQVFGNGNEFTRLNQFHVDGNMTVNHANGGSFVFLGVDPTNLGTQFNSVAGNLTVDNVTQSGQAATGFDVNALEETNVGGSIRSNMGNATGVGGWTSVGSRSNQSVAVGGDMTLKALTGFLSFGDFANDGLEVQNAQVAGRVTMDMGRDPANTALFGGGTSVSATKASSVTIMGRGAHDAVTVGASTIQGDLHVMLSGKSANSIGVDSLSITGNTSLMATGSGNEIRIDDQAPGSTFGGRVDIATTGKNNLLSINSKHRVPSTATTTFLGEVTADLGAGRNTLLLAGIGTVDFEAPATFDGGPGRNTLVNGGNLVGVEPELVNFD